MNILSKSYLFMILRRAMRWQLRRPSAGRRQTGRNDSLIISPLWFLSLITASVCLFGCTDTETIGPTLTPAVASETENGTNTLNGERSHRLQLRLAPYTHQGTVMVPMRPIFEWLGASVGFDTATQTISAEREDSEIRLRIGERSALISGRETTLPAPVANRHGSTFVPLRLVAEALGAEVAWTTFGRVATIRHRDREVTLSVPESSTDIHGAAGGGYTETVGRLIERGTDPNALDFQQMTPLYHAAETGRTDTVRLLLEYGADIDVRRESMVLGDTPLSSAIYRGHGTTAEVLLEHGAGPLSLHQAAALGSVERVGALLDSGADPNARLFGYNFGDDMIVDEKGPDAGLGDTPLHWAAGKTPTETARIAREFAEGEYPVTMDFRTEQGHRDVAALLLDRGADVNARDDSGYTPLHFAARWQGNTDLAALLLERGAYVNALTDGLTLTPLHEAAGWLGHPEMCALLIEHAANIDAQTDGGRTPLHEAASEGRADICAELLMYEANVDARTLNDYTPLHLAAESGDLDTVRLLLDQGVDVNARSEWGETPLHQAAGRTRASGTVQLLVDSGADVNARDDRGNTPLRAAALYGNTETARILLDSGADVTIRNDRGATPLHEAAGWYGNKRTCALLLNHGADVNARNQDGDTPLSIAIANDQNETAELLQARGGRK